MGFRQVGDLHVLGSQRQTGGLDEGAGTQLGQAVVFGPLAGADEGIAQSDGAVLGGKPQADATRGVLQVNVRAIHQCDHTLDGEAVAGAALQGRLDGNGGGFFRVDGLVGSFLSRIIIDLLSKQSLVVADGAEAAPVALAGVPFQVGLPGNVLHVVQIFRML